MLQWPLKNSLRFCLVTQPSLGSSVTWQDKNACVGDLFWEALGRLFTSKVMKTIVCNVVGIFNFNSWRFPCITHWFNFKHTTYRVKETVIILWTFIIKDSDYTRDLTNLTRCILGKNYLCFGQLWLQWSFCPLCSWTFGLDFFQLRIGWL